MYVTISPCYHDYLKGAVKLMESVEDNETNQWWASLELQRHEHGIQGIVNYLNGTLLVNFWPTTLSEGIFLMMIGGMMPCGIIKFRGCGEGMVKSGTKNFTFLTRGSSFRDLTFLTGGSSSEVWTTKAVEIGGACSDDSPPEH
ncbi:hypothetical protein Tco_1503183 [Tanacetum coccineum]